MFTILSLAFSMLGPFVGSRSDSALSSLNTVLAGGLFFILGPYVATAVNRWWAVRRDGVGGLWGAVDDLSTWAAVWFHRKTTADRNARALVLRYGLLSHALLYKEARNESDQLEDLIAAGLLLEHEVQALQPLAGKPLVVCAWLTHFWTRALSGELDVTPIAHAPQLSPMVLSTCMKARGAMSVSTLRTFSSAGPAFGSDGRALEASLGVAVAPRWRTSTASSRSRMCIS